MVSFGTVVLENTETKTILLRNTGSVAGKFKVLAEDGSAVSITPNEGEVGGVDVPQSNSDPRVESELPSYEEALVKVDFHAKQLGAFRELITFEVDGSEAKILDVNANVVEQRLELIHLHGNGQVHEIMFPTVYFGEQEIQEVLLVNNGPVQSSFTLALDAEAGFTEHLDAASKESNLDSSGILQSFVRGPESPIIVSPLEGTVDPYSSRKIKIIFKPRKRNANARFKSKALVHTPDATDFRMNVKIEYADSSDALAFTVSGKAVKPAIEATQNHLEVRQSPALDFHIDSCVDNLLVISLETAQQTLDGELR